LDFDGSHTDRLAVRAVRVPAGAGLTRWHSRPQWPARPSGPRDEGSVFTPDLGAVLRFADDFDVGALWINEATRFRLDNYPFGGVKHSGVGREGVRHAIEELSQLRFVGMTI
jgi:hypothetical protein